MVLQRHRKVYRDSQQNAGMCAHFLKSRWTLLLLWTCGRDGWWLNDAHYSARADFAEILVPLSQSPEISMAQKRQMIGKFLEVGSDDRAGHTPPIASWG